MTGDTSAVCRVTTASSMSSRPKACFVTPSRGVVVESVTPLKSVETSFACDLSGSRDAVLTDGTIIIRESNPAGVAEGTRHQRRARQHRYAVEIHGQDAQRQPALEAVACHDRPAGSRSMKSPATWRYSSARNLQAMRVAWAFPLIPFSSNVTRAWAAWVVRKLRLRRVRTERTSSIDHLWRDVESMFRMVKASSVTMSKQEHIAMKNEV